MMPSACTESIIVSAPPAESMILSATFDCVITLTRKVGGNKKTTISVTGDCGLMTIDNIASTAALIGLSPKMAKFCHTSNRLLVGCQCRCALSRLYFNSSLCRWFPGFGRFPSKRIKVPGLWEVSLQKDKKYEHLTPPAATFIALPHRQPATTSHRQLPPPHR
jgi:hypothetical protein